MTKPIKNENLSEGMAKSSEIMLFLGSPGATSTLAKVIANRTDAGDIITLKGDLGTGKTVFAKAFINSFFDNPKEVISPTFGILQTYSTSEFPVSHYDLYRIKNENELPALGIEESFARGVTLIEWPGIITHILPEDYLEIHLSYGDNKEDRMASLNGYGSWQTRLKEIFN